MRQPPSFRKPSHRALRLRVLAWLLSMALAVPSFAAPAMAAPAPAQNDSAIPLFDSSAKAATAKSPPANGEPAARRAGTAAAPVPVEAGDDLPESIDESNMPVLPGTRAPVVAVLYELAPTETSSGFIEMALSGAHQAYEEMRIPFTDNRISDAAEREPKLRELAEKHYRQIILIGHQFVPTVITLAERYPNIKFTVIDGMVPPLFNNVQSILFKDQEGAFLVGMLAAFASKQKKVGFIGGMDVPIIRNFAVGYEQGVHYVDPAIKISTDMVGMPGDVKSAWSNPKRAEVLARKMYGTGVDVIFAAAGASGNGIMHAAKDMEKLAIGVDSNQNYLYPRTVLTSMVKRVDRAVYETISDAREDRWRPGIKYLGIKEESIDFSVDRNNSSLITQPMLDALENAKDLIIRGSKVVESYQP